MNLFAGSGNVAAIARLAAYTVRTLKMGLRERWSEHSRNHFAEAAGDDGN
jgi:hypothetical protein